MKTCFHSILVLSHPGVYACMVLTPGHSLQELSQNCLVVTCQSDMNKFTDIFEKVLLNTLPKLILTAI